MRGNVKTIAVFGALVAGLAWQSARGADDGDATNSDVYADLGSTDTSKRAKCLDSLASAKSPSLTELQSALSDEPSLLVKGCIGEVIVRRMPSDREVTQLCASMLASDLPTRLEAVRVAGRTRPNVARDELQRVVSNSTESVEVRSAAAVALGRAGKDATSALSVIAAVRDLPFPLRAAILRGLALSGSEGVKEVAATAATTASSRDKEAAFAALADRDVTVGEALLNLLGSDLEGLRIRALAALTARNETSTAISDALGERLSDTSPVVRRMAVDALRLLGGAASMKTALLDHLGDESEPVRIATICALGHAFAGGDVTVADRLAELVSHDHFAIRYHASLALGALMDQRGLDAMRNPRPLADEQERAASQDAVNQITALTN